MDNLDGKKILVLGGTGSFGKAFIHYILKNFPHVGQITIVSRDEQKQYELKNELVKYLGKIKLYLGDIRDRDRMIELFYGHHIAIHAAAMKHMPIAEENPYECYKTNIQGTQNIIDASIYNKLEKVVSLSTDKAVLPINVYGASKLFLERLIVDGNINRRNEGTSFSVVRYANVLGSRGSVVPFFLNQKKGGILPITDFNMTRFSITLQESIDLVLFALDNMIGGEIFIPKTKSYKITSVAKAICPNCKLVEVGKRPGEKLNELMLSSEESYNAFELNNHYLILPKFRNINEYKFESIKEVENGFEYDSANNNEWLLVDQLENQIKGLSF